MNPVFQNAFLGSLVADALAMPVHWYYDTEALDRDYPHLAEYRQPKNPHPDSILWRSRYVARNERGDILHDQAKFWGQRDVHYHQFLQPGENTVNLKLAIELYRLVVRSGGYHADAWLERYIELMLKPNWHRDTYLEEYHRAFFDNYARGKKPRDCGIEDTHIGALAQVSALVAALDALGDPSPEDLKTTVEQHVALTHQGEAARRAARALVDLLTQMGQGSALSEAIESAPDFVSARSFQAWKKLPDRAVVGRQLTPACYLPESMTAALYLAWRHDEDFSDGIISNARVGGDNCHRGAVTGALLAAANGVPGGWLRQLRAMEALRCDSLAPTGVDAY